MLLYVYVLYNNLYSIIEHFPIKEGSKTNLFRKLKPLKALKNSIWVYLSVSGKGRMIRMEDPIRNDLKSKLQIEFSLGLTNI